MRPLRLAIVDDEPLARARLRRLLQRLGPERAEVAVECEDGADLVAALAAAPVDAVLLDVEMPGADGFAALAQLPAPRPAIVFVTGYRQHAVRAFEVRATDYLLKPVSLARLDDTVQRLQALAACPVAQAAAAPPYPQRLPLPLGQRQYLVPVEEIDTVAAQGNYIEVQAGARCFVLRRPLAGFAAELDPARFVQVHRSLIVRSDAVAQVRPAESGRFLLILHNGRQLRSGRSYRQAVQALLQAR